MFRIFLFILFVGLIIRLLLVGSTGFIADISFWKSWSLAAIDHDIVWTTQNTNINYPPGFIYVLWFMGKMYSIIGDPHDYNTFWRENNFGFLLVSKSIAIVSDVIIACLIYWFASQKEKLKQLGAIINSKIKNQNDKNDQAIPKETISEGEPNANIADILNPFYLAQKIGNQDKRRAPEKFVTEGFTNQLPLLLSSIFFLNPIVILDSALWGQVESFGILFTIISIILLFHKKPLFATVIFTIGTMMKLQNIIYIPIYFLFLLRYFDLPTVLKSIGVAAAAFFFINLPFVITNSMDKVLYLLTVNSDYFPWLSLNAHNLWWIVSGARGMEITDKITIIGILNAKTAGLIIFSACYLLCMILVWRKPTPRNFLLSLTVGIFSFFLFTTQSHERYSYPVIVLLLFLYPFLEINKSSIHRNSKIKNQNAKFQFKIQNFWNNTLSLMMGDAREGFPTRAAVHQSMDEHGMGNPSGRTHKLRYYFWFLYILLTIAIFFNIHFGLVINYPQNGFYPLTQITTSSLTILNSYFLILLFFLLLPFVFSQISKWYFVLCFLFFILGITTLNSSYFFQGKASLTAYKPIIIRQDYGSLQINKSVNSYSGWKKWSRLSDNYFYYRKGFGTHATSNLVFDINRQFKIFETDFGIDTEAGTGASVIFQIFGDDGKQLFSSEIKGRFDFPGHARVDISGVKYLGLIVSDAGDGRNDDHADWLNPVLYR